MFASLNFANITKLWKNPDANIIPRKDLSAFRKVFHEGHFAKFFIREHFYVCGTLIILMCMLNNKRIQYEVSNFYWDDISLHCCSRALDAQNWILLLANGMDWFVLQIRCLNLGNVGMLCLSPCWGDNNLWRRKERWLPVKEKRVSLILHILVARSIAYLQNL
jgi:hypothetical protein